MRKTQQEIIEKAKKRNLKENVITMLSDEQYTVTTLRNIYNFYSSHCEEDIDDTNVYFAIHEFYSKIYGYFNHRVYTNMFWHLSIQNILWIKEKYDNGTFSENDVMELVYIHNTIDKIDFEQMIDFFYKRKKVFKEYPEYDNCDILWISLYNLYSLFPAISLEKKIDIEFNILKSGKIEFKNKDRLIPNNAKYIFFNETMKYISGKFASLFNVIKNYYDMRYNKYAHNSYDDYHSYFFCYPDNEAVDSLNKILESFPNLFISKNSSKTRTLTIDATNPKPFSVSTKVSASGISIECTIYNIYELTLSQNTDAHGSHITVTGKDNPIKVLFTFDYNCFIYNNYLKRWTPISLPQITNLYRYDFWKDIFNSYADIVSEKGMIWKDLKRSFNNESGMPPLIANNILSFSNKKDMMLSMYKKSDVINWNKKDLYIGYLTMKALPLVRDSDKNILIDFVNKNDLLYPQGNISVNVRKLLYDVITARFKAYDSNYVEEDYVKHQIMDYIDMSKDLHRKISLSFNTPNRLQEEHDEVMFIHRDKHAVKVVIPKDTKFAQLRKMLPDEFEWIKKGKRLVKEGLEMHHCVASYAGKINRDECAIYSIIYNGTRYTIEFSCYKDEYRVVQIQGRYDSGCPAEVREYIKSFLKKS